MTQKRSPTKLRNETRYDTAQQHNPNTVKHICNPFYVKCSTAAPFGGQNYTPLMTVCIEYYLRGGHNKQDLRRRQKPTYFLTFTNNIWSCFYCCGPP